MRIELKASLILVALVTALSIVVQVSGLASDFILGQTIFLVGAIVINVGVVIWALAENARERTWLQQLTRSAVIGLVAGIGIVVVSWLLLAVVFPDALDELADAARAYLDGSDLPEEEVARQLAAIESATPLSQSLPGGIGAFFTSVVTGAVFGAFRRKR